MKLTRSAWVGILAVLAACATPNPVASSSSRRIDGPADYTVYWDVPENGHYWLPKGTEASKVVKVGKECEAKLDGGMWHHIPVPPAYDYLGFHFIEPVSAAAKNCVIDRLGAVPALTVYEKKR